MDFKKNSHTLLNIGAVISSYLAITSIALIIIGYRILSWKMFMEQYINPTILFLFAVLTAAAGIIFYSLYSRRRIGPSFFQSCVFRCSALLSIVLFGIYSNFKIMDIIISLYAVYSILFITRSPEKTRLYKSTIGFLDRLISALLHIESRTPAMFALLLLISLPFFLILKKTAIAENIAVYVYYLLIITVILQIIEFKRGIVRENHLLALLKDSLNAIHAAFAGKEKRTKAIARVRSLGKQFFTRNEILYIAGLITILGSVHAIMYLYWENEKRVVDTNPIYRSEIKLLKSGGNEVRFTTYTDEIAIPIRIKHLPGNPLQWHASGADAVKLGVVWFNENQAGQMGKKVHEDYQPLPKGLFINESIEMELKLKLPTVPGEKNYEAWIGLVSGGNWWFSKWGDGVQKLHIYVDKLSYNKKYHLDTKMYDSIQRKMEEVWSRQLYHSVSGYRSTIEVLKKGLFNGGKISVVLKNNGNIPWPVQNQNPVKLGVVWIQRIEEGGKNHYIHLMEEKHALPDVVLPGNKQIVELPFDPFKVSMADEIWIGMVHEGKTWFYKRGDSALKFIQNIDKRIIIAQQTAILSSENMKMSKQLDKLSTSIRGEEGTTFKNSDYRSKILLLNQTWEQLEVRNGRLDLELEVTNGGRIPWMPDPSGKQKPADEKPGNVNLGILWFDKAGEKGDYAMRKAEERCAFPVTVLENVTIRMECKIGKKINPGNYEVWIGPVHEYVSWFYNKGDQVLKLDVTVP